ncbi:MAG: PqqD family protein [Endomicrobiales bacterium]
MKKKVYVANPEIVFRKEGKEALLYDSQTGKFDIINETGIFIWKLCNGTNTEEDIVAKVLDAYSVSRPAAVKDVKNFLKCVSKSGLITAESR